MFIALVLVIEETDRCARHAESGTSHVACVRIRIHRHTPRGIFGERAPK